MMLGNISHKLGEFQKMKIKLLIAACSLCLTSTMALAQDDTQTREEKDEQRQQHSGQKMNYSFIEVSSLQYDMDIGGVDIEPDGYNLNLSLSLGDSLFGVVDRKRSDGSFAGADYDFDTEGYGFGLRGDSWFASYTYNTWEMGNTEFDVDTIRLGFRDQWTKNLEFNASYSWNNIEDADNDDGFQVGLAYSISDSFDLIAEYETIGGHFDIDYVSAGIRLNF